MTFSTETNMPGDSDVQRIALSRNLYALCLAVLPLWGRHLATSRLQSEEAVGEMLSAFSMIGPNLERAVAQSREITDAMVPSDGGVGMRGLVAACEQLLAPVVVSADSAVVDAGRQVLDLLQKAVEKLEHATRALPYDAQAVSEKLEQMYVGFQYQDRISQMMALLQEDMGRLVATLESTQIDANELAVAPWLQRLESLYAMAEQRRDHNAQSDQKAGDADEVSFF